MSQVISLLHDKGGCAKTTSCVNIAFALWLLGKKVLLVDTDPQCTCKPCSGPAHCQQC